MLLRTVAATLFLMGISASAQAAKVCAWIVETNEADDERKLTMWLQSDAEIDFFYQIGGDGIVTRSGKGNAPNDGTFSLMPGKANSPWSYGSTLDSAGRIDVTIELHKMPADIFSKAPTPLLAKFSFQRAIPENEKKPPATLAKKQCAVIAAH